MTWSEFRCLLYQCVHFLTVWFRLFNLLPMIFFFLSFFFFLFFWKYKYTVYPPHSNTAKGALPRHMYTKDKYFGAGLLHLPSFWISNRSVSGKRSVSFTLFLSKLFKSENWMAQVLFFPWTWQCFILNQSTHSGLSTLVTTKPSYLP